MGGQIARVVVSKSDIEQMLLDCLETKGENSGLACQVNLTDKQDGLVVHIAPQTEISRIMREECKRVILA